MTKTMTILLLLISSSVFMIGGIQESYATVTSGTVGPIVGFGNYDTWASTTSGSFVKLNPLIGPIGNNNFNTHNLYAFDEGQNLEALSPISVNIIPSTSSAGTLPPGIYASHYIVYDPVDSAIEGCVDFDSDIVGVITSTTLLAASDSFQNTDATGADYQNPVNRGLESPPQDLVDLPDSDTICVAFRASLPGDSIRVLTDFSPGAFFDGKGQRSDVNDFLIFGQPKESRPTVTDTDNDGVETYFLVIKYGNLAATPNFEAILNGVDISGGFSPVSDTFDIIQLDLESGRNVLKVSVDGIRTDNRIATDTDRLTFLLE